MIDFAKASKASYAFGGRGSLQKRTQEANKNAPAGFLINEPLSTRDISVFTNAEQNRSIIAHKGTDLNVQSAFSDVKADIALLFGGQPPLFQKRLKRTVLVAKKLRENNPDGIIDLTGHSLGGSSSSFSLSKSKYLKDNIGMLQTFNTGASPLDSHTLKENNTQVIHNVIKGDPISSNLESENVNIIEGKKNTPKLSDRIINTISSIALGSTSPILNEAFQGSMRLRRGIANNHSIDNFID